MDQEEVTTELIESLGGDDSYLSDQDFRQALRQFAGLQQAKDDGAGQSQAVGEDFEPLV